MAFKPLTRKTLVKKEGELSTLTKEQEELEKLNNSTKLPDIIKTTEERIRIIFDDSGSMASLVPGSAPSEVALAKNYSNSYSSQDLSRLTLAQDATIDYMRNCKPRVTAIEIAPLNQESKNLTKNLPLLAVKIKEIKASGGTPLFRAMGKLVDEHKEKKYTRALIFTDGEAGDYYDYSCDVRPTLFAEIKEMGIPIDLIIIKEKSEASLSSSEIKLKNLIESTKGTFLICKDGNVFRKNLKYFAPPLRYMLPQIASKEL